MKTEIKENKVPKRVVGRRLLKGVPLNKDIFSFEGPVTLPTYSFHRTQLTTVKLEGFYQITRKYPNMRVDDKTKATAYVAVNVATGRQETVYEAEGTQLRVKVLTKTAKNYKELQKASSLRIMRSNPGITTGADTEILS